MNCRSPDGEWSATYSGDTQKASLWLAHDGPTRLRMYQSAGLAWCTNVTWAAPHTLLFDDDYQLIRLNPATRRHTTIAGWSDFIVSPDGRWIAGWAFGSGSAMPAETVGVLSIDGKTCLAVPHGSHESDEAAGFTHDGKSVVVKRWPYDPGNGVTSSSFTYVAYAISSLRPSADFHC